MATEKTLSRTPVTITVTLASGEVWVLHHARVPRFWKSWAMGMLPYGTAFTGATFTIS